MQCTDCGKEIEGIEVYWDFNNPFNRKYVGKGKPYCMACYDTILEQDETKFNSVLDTYYR